MRPPLHFLCDVRSAVLALGLLVAVPAQAEDAPALPTCRPTVPVPPPEPPTRPENLRVEAPVPLPPARPAELSVAAPAGPDVTPASPAVPGDGLSLRIEPGPSQPLPAPLPPERPPELSSATLPPLGEAVPPLPPDVPRCIPELTAPLPPARPPELSPNPAAIPDAPGPPGLADRPETPEIIPEPPVRPPELSGEAAQKLTAAPIDDSECLRGLDALGVKYAKMTPIVNGQCSVSNPLSVSALGGGIAIGAPETMVCRLAEGLMRWTAEVQQAAEKELGDTLKGYSLGGTYVCRGMNHGSEAPLSEHAFANAVDIMGFSFAKRAPISVGKLHEGSKEAVFLAAVRAKACAVFTTVLGPGTDEAHGNHLHLDERERKVGSRICQ